MAVYTTTHHSAPSGATRVTYRQIEPDDHPYSQYQMPYQSRQGDMLGFPPPIPDSVSGGAHARSTTNTDPRESVIPISKEDDYRNFRTNLPQHESGYYPSNKQLDAPPNPSAKSVTFDRGIAQPDSGLDSSASTTRIKHSEPGYNVTDDDLGLPHGTIMWAGRLNDAHEASQRSSARARDSQLLCEASQQSVEDLTRILAESRLSERDLRVDCQIMQMKLRAASHALSRSENATRTLLRRFAAMEQEFPAMSKRLQERYPLPRELEDEDGSCDSCSTCDV